MGPLGTDVQTDAEPRQETINDWPEAWPPPWFNRTALLTCCAWLQYDPTRRYRRRWLSAFELEVQAGGYGRPDPVDQPVREKTWLPGGPAGRRLARELAKQHPELDRGRRPETEEEWHRLLDPLIPEALHAKGRGKRGAGRRGQHPAWPEPVLRWLVAEHTRQGTWERACSTVGLETAFRDNRRSLFRSLAAIR